MVDLCHDIHNSDHSGVADDDENAPGFDNVEAIAEHRNPSQWFSLYAAPS
jgi:hypothetical protein